MSGWLTPNSLLPAAAHCRRLFIPGDAQMLANVSGAIRDLCNAWNWEVFGSVSIEDVTAAMETMYERFLVDTWNMIGAVVPCACSTTPTGTLECDGAQYARVDYPDLYRALADIFVVDADFFTVPDLRHRTVGGIGQAGGSGITWEIGDTFGEEAHTLNESEIPAHTHTEITAVATVINGGVEAPAAAAIPGTGITGSAGSGQSHNNIQPTMALRYVIIAR